MRFLALNISILFFLISIPTSSLPNLDNSNDEKVEISNPSFTKKTIAGLKFSAKFVTACTIALGAHYVLEFISTFAHEHGHGVASQVDYNVTMKPLETIAQPWGGTTSFQEHPVNLFFSLIAGPLTGITTTYIQSIMLTALNEYLNKNKSLRTSIYEGIKFPITFFTNAIKTGKKYSSALLKQQVLNKSLTNKTVLSLTTDILLFLRMGRIVGESIYGLLPYHDPSELVKGASGGDGEKIWKMMLGSQAPTFTGNLSYITLGIIASPYLIGLGQAIYEKIKQKSTTTDDALPLPE